MLADSNLLTLELNRTLQFPPRLIIFIYIFYFFYFAQSRMDKTTFAASVKFSPKNQKN